MNFERSNQLQKTGAVLRPECIVLLC